MYVIRFQAALIGRCSVRRGVKNTIISILRLYLAAERNERAIIYAAAIAAYSYRQ